MRVACNICVAKALQKSKMDDAPSNVFSFGGQGRLLFVTFVQNCLRFLRQRPCLFDHAPKPRVRYTLSYNCRPNLLYNTLVQGVSGVPYAYTGTADCFRKTLKHEGVQGLYRGLGPNFLKALPAIAISYAIFEKARGKLSTYVPRYGKNGQRVMVGGESSK